jgi:hypothetical protein
MQTLFSLFPSADELLKVPVEDLAPTLLKLAAEQMQPAGFWPDAVGVVPGISGGITNSYPFDKKPLVDAHLSRTWNWVERNGYVEPSAGMNGRNGWRVFTPQGAAVAAGHDMDRLRLANEFPKALLHPRIRDRAAAAILRNSNSSDQGELTEAVRSAFHCSGGSRTRSWGIPAERLRYRPYARRIQRHSGTLRR